MIKKLLLITLSVFMSLNSFAQKNEVRLIISDPMWETAAFHNRSTQTGYSYTPHLAVEYMYGVKSWLSVGASVDYQRTAWTQDSTRRNFYNLCVLPTVRFTYMRHGLVDLHSGLSLGLDVNGGSEEFYKGGKTIVSGAVDINYLGVSVGKNHWYGTFDLGGTFAIYDKTAIFLLSARIFRVGVAYRF